jgi:NAD(P)-dependent dehydrogenase (short-subunit alcohol dehydrogenase family)
MTNPRETAPQEQDEMQRAMDKVVVVLGASSEGGTGWRTAEVFAREGAKVVVAARSRAGIEDLARRIGGVAFQCDAGDEAQVAALADFAAKTYGRIDYAVNAAGLAVPSTVADLDAETLLSSTTVNLFGHLYFLKHMARHTAAGGSLVSIASLSATAVIPGNVIYGVAKAGVVAAIRYAAVEYAPRGIRVNAISPGIIDTPMVESLTSNPAVFSGFLKETPLGHIVSPEEIAKCALWLCVDALSMTGTSTIVDGGMHLRRPPHPDELAENAYAEL